MATDSATKAVGDHQVRVEIIQDVKDFDEAFVVQASAFGTQANDALWVGMNPGWDTASGKQAGAARLAERFKATTMNDGEQPNTIFLKATVPDPKDAESMVIAGVAIWQQLSAVPGHGDPPSEDIVETMGLRRLHPSSETEQRFLAQAFSSLTKRRFEVVREKKDSSSNPPATFVLDLCAVDPAHQRRGIAGRLVQYGLDEAERRGGLEATTEASSMGRGVYQKLGFKPEGDGEDIVYHLDEDFKGRTTPSNVFLRTWG